MGFYADSYWMCSVLVIKCAGSLCQNGYTDTSNRICLHRPCPMTLPRDYFFMFSTCICDWLLFIYFIFLYTHIYIFQFFVSFFFWSELSYCIIMFFFFLFYIWMSSFLDPAHSTSKWRIMFKSDLNEFGSIWHSIWFGIDVVWHELYLETFVPQFEMIVLVVFIGNNNKKWIEWRMFLRD